MKVFLLRCNGFGFSDQPCSPGKASINVIAIKNLFQKHSQALLHISNFMYHRSILQHTKAKLFLLANLPYFSLTLWRQSRSLSPSYRSENIDMQFSFTKDRLQHECYVNKLVQHCKQSHRAEMRQQAMIKVPPQKPHPSSSVWCGESSLRGYFPRQGSNEELADLCKERIFQTGKHPNNGNSGLGKAHIHSSAISL